MLTTVADTHFGNSFLLLYSSTLLLFMGFFYEYTARCFLHGIFYEQSVYVQFLCVQLNTLFVAPYKEWNKSPECVKLKPWWFFGISPVKSFGVCKTNYHLQTCIRNCLDRRRWHCDWILYVHIFDISISKCNVYKYMRNPSLLHQTLSEKGIQFFITRARR